MVDDVWAWEGHVACDEESRSEIVVPVFCGEGGEKKVRFVDASSWPFYAEEKWNQRTADDCIGLSRLWQ